MLLVLDVFAERMEEDISHGKERVEMGMDAVYTATTPTQQKHATQKQHQQS